MADVGANCEWKTYLSGESQPQVTLSLSNKPLCHDSLQIDASSLGDVKGTPKIEDKYFKKYVDLFLYLFTLINISMGE